ncbi:MAG: response regulator [Candidatus Omnitrophota bacterium]
MKKILIIDDETKIRSTYREVLTKEGFEVFEAKSASQATFKLISTQHIDLVLLDLNMPEINGVVMRDVINEYDPDFKIIVASVYPIDEQRQAIPRADDYFDKVQGVDVLLEKVRKVLGCAV